LLAEYQRAPEVTRERLYIDTMQEVMSRSPKVLIDVENGNNLMFLPLDKLLSGRSSSDRSLQNLSGSNRDSSSLIDEFSGNSSRTRETRQ
jgi:membrane protease subunit HflK